MPSQEKNELVTLLQKKEPQKRLLQTGFISERCGLLQAAPA